MVAAVESDRASAAAEGAGVQRQAGVAGLDSPQGLQQGLPGFSVPDRFDIAIGIIVVLQGKPASAARSSLWVLQDQQATGAVVVPIDGVGHAVSAGIVGAGGAPERVVERKSVRMLSGLTA